MQTFLPFPNFAQSASVLDYRRLGKQRVECLQILKALSEPTYGWQNHPAVKMWRGYKQSLVNYGLSICDEWTKRGFKDTCHQQICDFIAGDALTHNAPPWLGNPEFHASHRSNLLRKDATWYSQFGWKEPNDLPYFWPSKEA